MEIVEIVIGVALVVFGGIFSTIGMMIKDRVKKAEDTISAHATQIGQNTKDIAINTANDQNRASAFAKIEEKVDEILKKVNVIEGELQYIKGSGK